VVCLPGAELTDVIDERTYKGRVRVKVGPVTAAYKGTARLEEVIEEEHLMRLAGEGKETAGSGSAKLALTGRLSAEGADRTQVKVDAEIDVAGKMAQFGRGLMEDVSRQLFKQFAASMQETLAQPAAASNGMAEPVPPPGSSSESDPQGTKAEAPPAAPPAKPGADVSKPAAVAQQPVGVVSLVFRAMWQRVKRLFGA
jgi:carbon monoxide dehydrogenase subunit G